MLTKICETYKLWHNFLIQFRRESKYTLGSEIDKTFLQMLELAVQASYSLKPEKISIVKQTAVKLDILKFLLQISWELKLLDHKKYQILASPLAEIGKMLGGWLKYLEK